MTDSISLNKFIAIYNDYIADSSATNFLTYASSKGYITLNTNKTLKEFDETILPKKGNATLSFDTSNQKHLQKLTEFIKLIYSYDSRIEDTRTLTKEKAIQNLSDSLLVEGAHLNFDEESAQQIAEIYQLGDDKPNVKKVHKVRNFIGKKILLPTAIVTLLTTGAGAIIGGISSIAGSSIFWSGNVALGIASVASAGFVAGLLLTPIITIAKNVGTRLYYKNKYGRGQNNLKRIRDSKITNANEIESKLSDLPILSLMNLIKENEEKLREFETSGSKNPFKRFAYYFKRKANRNRMHELVKFTKVLKTNANIKGIGGSTKKSYNAMLDYVSSFIDDDLRENYHVSIIKRKGNNNKHKVLHNYDIWAKAELKDKGLGTNASNVRKQVTETTRGYNTETLTGGKGLVTKLTDEIKSRVRTPIVKLDKKFALIANENSILEKLKGADLTAVADDTDISVEDLTYFKNLLQSNYFKKNGERKTSATPLRNKSKWYDFLGGKVVALTKYNSLTQYMATEYAYATAPVGSTSIPSSTAAPKPTSSTATPAPSTTVTPKPTSSAVTPEPTPRTPSRSTGVTSTTTSSTAAPTVTPKPTSPTATPKPAPRTPSKSTGATPTTTSSTAAPKPTTTETPSHTAESKPVAKTPTTPTPRTPSKSTGVTSTTTSSTTTPKSTSPTETPKPTNSAVTPKTTTTETPSTTTKSKPVVKTPTTPAPRTPSRSTGVTPITSSSTVTPKPTSSTAAHKPTTRTPSKRTGVEQIDGESKDDDYIISPID